MPQTATVGWETFFKDPVLKNSCHLADASSLPPSLSLSLSQTPLAFHSQRLITVVARSAHHLTSALDGNAWRWGARLRRGRGGGEPGGRGAAFGAGALRQRVGCSGGPAVAKCVTLRAASALSGKHSAYSTFIQ